VIHPSFVAFVEAVVLPGKEANPTHRRLDGQPTGGNFDVAGEFRYRSRTWKVHADTHYETLLYAYEAAKRGSDPFVEAPTKRGMSLDLNDELRRTLTEPRFKYIYIYET
jgi:hypothetical protein